MKKFILLKFILFVIHIQAQIGIGTINPNAAIEVLSSNDGFLLPRVALTNKSTCTILTPTVSEIVYNTATSGEAPNNVRQGFYFWAGTSWIELENASGTKNWRITGNAGTDAAIHFLGTTDEVDLNFRRANIKSGNLGVANTSLGVNALLVNTAVGNTAFGVKALLANTTATGNMAFGNGTLQHNAGPNNMDNTSLGFEVLKVNNSVIAAFAKNNTGMGVRALRANTTGHNNTAVGRHSLTSNTTGIFNTGVGTGTLLSNISEGSNVAFGTAALRHSITGNDNNGIGRGSLELNTVGYNNTATGSNSLNANTTGTDNVAIGFISMIESTTGSQNTAVGAFALQHTSTGNNNTAIGYEASAPPLFSGSDNVTIGHQSLTFLTTGSNNIGIGKGVELPDGKASNQVRIGNTAITYAGIQVPWTITSDRKWKSDIRDSSLGLDFIKALNPVSYIRKNDKGKKLEYGFIAQELDQALTKSNAVNNGIISKADDGILNVRYNDFLAPMVKAIQQQQAIIEKLITRIRELEKNKTKK